MRAAPGGRSRKAHERGHPEQGAHAGAAESSARGGAGLHPLVMVRLRRRAGRDRAGTGRDVRRRDRRGGAADSVPGRGGRSRARDSQPRVSVAGVLRLRPVRRRGREGARHGVRPHPRLVLVVWLAVRPHGAERAECDSVYNRHTGPLQIPLRLHHPAVRRVRCLRPRADRERRDAARDDCRRHRAGRGHLPVQLGVGQGAAGDRRPRRAAPPGFRRTGRGATSCLPTPRRTSPRARPSPRSTATRST